MSAPQTVWVAIYECKRDETVEVFASAEAAELWRQKIAYEEWTGWFEPETYPEDRKVAADEYFEMGESQGVESFRVEQHGVKS